MFLILKWDPMFSYTTMASLVKQPSLFPLFLVNFVGTLGFSIVLPFLVFVVMKYGGNAIVYGLLAVLILLSN